MNILVTGSEGFIGNNILESYLNTNSNIFGWDKNGIFDYSKNKLFDLQIVNIEDVLKAFEIVKPDILIHCAGNADVMLSKVNVDFDFQMNYILTKNLLLGLIEKKLFDMKFVLLSSASVYGEPLSKPINELHSINPLSPYAMHKHFSEMMCQYVSKTYNMDVKILRIFSTYGPGQRKMLFWDMYKKYKTTGKIELWGDGTESRDYIYISDLICAIRLIVEKAQKNELIFNVANGIETSIKDVACFFAKCLNMSYNNIIFNNASRGGEPKNWLADITKIRKLGYEPKVMLENGVKNYISWVNSICDEVK